MNRGFYFEAAEDEHQHIASNLFKGVFSALRDQLSSASSKLYNNSRFEYGQIERTWVGLLCTSMVSKFGDAVFPFEEYTVYENGKHVGRADLLIHWLDSNGKKYILICESKQCEHQSTKSLISDFTAQCDSQLNRYVGISPGVATADYVYAVGLEFGWIRREDILKYTRNNSMEILRESERCSFVSLLFDDCDGVLVRGSLRSV